MGYSSIMLSARQSVALLEEALPQPASPVTSAALAVGPWDPPQAAQRPFAIQDGSASATSETSSQLGAPHPGETPTRVAETSPGATTDVTALALAELDNLVPRTYTTLGSAPHCLSLKYMNVMLRVCEPRALGRHAIRAMVPDGRRDVAITD